MAGTRIAAVALAYAALCPIALAADEQPPQTGTIEVEVVYKDTGEPVEGVLVIVTQDRKLWASRPASNGRLSVAVGPVKEGDTRAVQVRHLSPRAHPDEAKASTFIDRYAARLQHVQFASGENVAHARFEVERGWRLHGTVRRRDGSPLAGGMVTAAQNDADCAPACGITDASGAFDMRGVAPAERAEVTLIAPPAPSEQVYNRTPLVRQSVTLTGSSTTVDLEIETVLITVVVVVDVSKPLWPFSSATRDMDLLGTVLVGGPSGDELRLPEIIYWLQGSAAAQGPLQTTQYKVVLGELPARAPVTVDVGFRRRAASTEIPLKLLWSSTRTVELGTTNEIIRLRVHEPYALLSRALLFAVAPGLVLAICILFIIHQARKHRHRRGST